MAEITDIYYDPIKSSQPEQPNPLIDIWRRLMAGEQDQVLTEQGANVRSGDLTPTQSPIVQQLLGQQMTRGLSQDATNPANTSGLTYDSPLSGYSGPTRSSDIEPVRTATANNQIGVERNRAAEEARIQMESLLSQPGPGGKGTLKQMMEFLGLAKGAPSVAQAGIINSRYPGMAVDPNEGKLEMARMNMDMREERNQQIRAERARIPDLDRRNLDNFREAYNLTKGLAGSHRTLFGATGTKISDALKSAIASSSKANTISQAFINTEKLEAENERQYAAEYNNVVGNLYTMTQERQMNDRDAVRNLKSYDPAVGPAQFQQNLKARLNGYERKFRHTTIGLKAQGRTITGFEKIEIDPVPSEQQTAATPAAQGNTIKVISPDGKKGSIPAAQLQEALKAGYRQVQ